MTDSNNYLQHTSVMADSYNYLQQLVQWQIVIIIFNN